MIYCLYHPLWIWHYHFLLQFLGPLCADWPNDWLPSCWTLHHQCTDMPVYHDSTLLGFRLSKSLSGYLAGHLHLSNSPVSCVAQIKDGRIDHYEIRNWHCYWEIRWYRLIENHLSNSWGPYYGFGFEDHSEYEICCYSHLYSEYLILRSQWALPMSSYFENWTYLLELPLSKPIKQYFDCASEFSIA